VSRQRRPGGQSGYLSGTFFCYPAHLAADQRLSFQSSSTNMQKAQYAPCRAHAKALLAANAGFRSQDIHLFVQSWSFFTYMISHIHQACSRTPGASLVGPRQHTIFSLWARISSLPSTILEYLQGPACSSCMILSPYLVLPNLVLPLLPCSMLLCHTGVGRFDEARAS
jgi:hypothetical protein